MSLTNQDIKKIAKLARIRISENEVEVFQKELSGILNIMTELQQIPTDGIPRMANILEDAELPMRVDQVSDGGMVEDLMKNAPANEYNCFVVPKVIE
jgi:aspartyl-tRNA(Asn)/glutamyl-tRNA(Gln) amidotransferase subunit C